MVWLAATMTTPLSAEPKTTTLDVSAIVPERCTVANAEINLGKIGGMAPKMLAGRSRIAPDCSLRNEVKLSLPKEQLYMLGSDASGVRIPIEISLEGMDIVVNARLTGEEPAGVYRGSVELTLEW